MLWLENMFLLKPVFHWVEYYVWSVIFRQICAATKLKAVKLFQWHRKCRFAHKIPPSGEWPLYVGANRLQLQAGLRAVRVP